MSDIGADAMRPRLLAVAVVGVLAVPAGAAPVPKALKKPATVVITLTRDSADPNAVYIHNTNNAATDLTWAYTTTPLAGYTIAVFDERGVKLDTTHPDAWRSPFAKPITATVPPGESRWSRFTLPQCFESGERPKGKLTVKVTFHHGGERYESDSLTVN